MHIEQNPRILIWLFTVGGMLLCSLLGATSGAVLNLVLHARYAAQNTWEPLSQLILDDPADRLVAIVLSDSWSSTIYVRTAAQVIYSCPEAPLSERAEIRCTPLPSGVVPTPEYEQSCEGQRVHPPPTPPGVVISQFQVCPLIPDGWYQESHVLLKDGSLWKWSVGENEDASREIIICPAALSWLLGTILGLGVGVRVYRRRRKEILSLKG